MARQEKIVVTVDSDGTMTYEVQGVSGKSCETEDYTFLDSLGQAGERKHTAEYHKHEPAKGKLHIRR